MNNKHISFSLSQIPKNLGGSRLGDLYLFFDNLSDADPFAKSYPLDMDFPIKSESMLALTLQEGYIKLKINLQDVEVHGGQVLGLMPGCIFQVLEYSDDLRYYCMMVSPESDSYRYRQGFIHVKSHTNFGWFGWDISQTNFKIALNGVDSHTL